MKNISKKSWIHSALFVGESQIHGSGIFSRERLPAGTIVIKWGGTVLNAAEMAAGTATPHTAVSIDEDRWLAASDAQSVTLDDYMNHSCDPTCWMRDAITIETKKLVEPFIAELTADYAIWLNDKNYIMKTECACGSIGCRKKITGVDWKREAVIKANYQHFSPFLNRRIEKFQR